MRGETGVVIWRGQRAMRRDLNGKSVVAIRNRDPRRMAAAPNDNVAANPEVRELKISSIRKNEQLQHRAVIDPEIVAEWSQLMREGTVFPPITVWCDGEVFWLSDGFKRTAAADLAGFTEILAEVRHGSFSDAQWDSYRANAAHGFHLTSSERRQVLRLALEHRNSATLSDVQLAAHLHLARTTFRRWKKELSWPSGQDSLKVVTRGETTYTMSAANIGKASARSEGHPANRRTLRADLAAMKENSSPIVRPLLAIIEHWVFGRKCSPAQCLNAIEGFLWTHRKEFVGPPPWPQPTS